MMMMIIIIIIITITAEILVRQYTSSYPVPSSSVTMCRLAKTSLKPRTASVDHIQTRKTVSLPGRVRNIHFPLGMSPSCHICTLTGTANRKMCYYLWANQTPRDPVRVFGTTL